MVGIVDLGFKKIELGRQSFSVSQVRGVIVVELVGTFSKIKKLLDFKIYLL